MSNPGLKAARVRCRESRVITVGAAIFAVGVAFLFPETVRAQTQPPPAPAEKTFDLASDPDFGKFDQVVTRFAAKHRPGKESSFCVIGVSTEGTKSAWVIWREGRQILLWEGGDDLEQSRRVIHLKSDVVASEADLHGSTYLVTRSWVDDLTRRCEDSGVKLRTDGPANSRKRKGVSK